MSFNKRSYAYLAGVIDGDGGVYICKSKVNGCDSYQTQLCVANSNLKLMKWLQHHFGGCLHKNSSAGDSPNFGSVVRKIYYNKVDNWQWRLTGNRRISEVLSQTKPYFSINKERCVAAMDLTALHGKYRASKERQLCFEKMESASRDGLPDADYKAAYFAGYFDAEGSASLNAAKTPQGFRVLIRLSGNDISVLKWFQTSLGFGRIYSTIQDGKLRYTWSYRPTDDKQMERFLLSILPYLIVKRQQAQLCLDMIRVPADQRTMERCTEDRNKLMALNSFSSLTTNMPARPESGRKIESEPVSDYGSAPLVTVTA